MNEKRLVYYELSLVPLPSRDTNFFDSWLSLCHFCRYAIWLGCCEAAELECTHPLQKMYGGPWDPEDVWQGDDCWGFRPRVSVDILAEWIGQRLQGQHVRLPFRSELEAGKGESSGILGYMDRR
jgi:hypothetical protein